MFKKIKLALAGLGLSLAGLMAAPADAAADYCREYTRTVFIGNRSQEAYGTACLQPDGSWMIVGEGLGNDIPANVSSVDYVIHDNRQVIRPPRVVYYTSPRVVYRNQPSFIWYHNGHYRNGHYVSYNKKRYDRNDRWDRYDRNDRRDNRGRGHGHRN